MIVYRALALGLVFAVCAVVYLITERQYRFRGGPRRPGAVRLVTESVPLLISSFDNLGRCVSQTRRTVLVRPRAGELIGRTWGDSEKGCHGKSTGIRSAWRTAIRSRCGDPRRERRNAAGACYVRPANTTIRLTTASIWSRRISPDASRRNWRTAQRGPVSTRASHRSHRELGGRSPTMKFQSSDEACRIFGLRRCADEAHAVLERAAGAVPSPAPRAAVRGAVGAF